MIFSKKKQTNLKISSKIPSDSLALKWKWHRNIQMTSKYSKLISFASFDVEIAAASLMIHCSAYSSASSGSKIEIEWSCTIVAVFNYAVLRWDSVLNWSINIRGNWQIEKRNDFHLYLNQEWIQVLYTFNTAFP